MARSKRNAQKSKGYNSRKGWHGEPARHAMSAKGIPTAEQSQPGINITVVGMDSSTQPAPSRLMGLPGRPGVPPPAGVPGEPPVVSFAEDQALDREIEEMEDRVTDLKTQVKTTEIEIAGMRDERKSMQKIHRAERDELLSKLLGRKVGMFTSHRDLSPAQIKQFRNFESKQQKSEGEMEGKIRGKETALKTFKIRHKTAKRDLSRRRDYIEDIKEMREKEQVERIRTLEQTRTLNRVIREGQR